jgi:gamma-glutamyltranspeptidase
MPPPSSGGSTVGEALNILEGFDMATPDRALALRRYLEASKLAFADRNRWVGDPAFVSVPLEALLSKDFAGERRCLIGATALPTPVAPGDVVPPYAPCAGAAVSVPESAQGLSTNHLTVVDRYGNVVSYTTTVEQFAGSGITVPGYGFLLNNELTDFDPAGATRRPEPARRRQAPALEHGTHDRAPGRAPIARRRQPRRLDDHHDGAADPARPTRLRHVAARRDRSSSRVAAEHLHVDGRAGLHLHTETS